MAITYLSGERIQGRSDDEILSPQTSWKVLDSYDPQNETATAFTAKDNLLVLCWAKRAGSGSNGVKLRFNGETSSDNTIDGNAEANNSGTYYGEANVNNVDLFNTSVEEAFAVVEIRNEASRDKMIHVMANGGSGTGNNISPMQDAVALYQPATSSERITEVNITPQASFQSGSKVVVLGCDDDEADSGTDFWSLLKDTAITSSGELNSGAFTAKDFLRVQIKVKKSATASTHGVRFNDDSNSNTNYVNRSWINNATSSDDRTDVPALYAGGTDNTNWNYKTLWIANISGREKLIISRDSENKGLDAQIETYISVGKFKTTSGQITIVDICNHDGSTFTADANSRITVWGGSA